MKKRVIILGMILVLGTATLLTGCGEEKTVVEQQADLAKNLTKKANDAMDKVNNATPEINLDGIKGE